MSLKENINMVKEELNSEEKFFEKAVITERFVKKYKNLMITTVVAVIAVVGANIAYNANEQSKITAANVALIKLQEDAGNSDALNELKSLSPNLYDVWIFSKAVVDKDLEAIKKLKNSKALIISDLVKYELANDADSLNEYASKQDAIFRDLALLQSAVILLNTNKIEEAHNKLLKISQESSLSNLAKALLHYGVK
ncbi:hypothetical protein HUE87_07565 [Candidatus Sulfurimonas marisnigri]|uniref:Tetratricopeptide repeat-like domain-containing protein n=1 Tax=Candidatus Sulfurimonas marisnigri TaxID=2740405 RepID=A0A7S7RPN9_9BACT|nr:hypothetical protein [Candidatus Sulfurimonas marisnigri]QOY53759.1 hypothetical protein HUE87_07565 [Candidatus Sulfurimonas marisnigri]